MMIPDNVIPLVGSGDLALRHALAFPMSHYGERFVDVEFWLPCVDVITQAH